MEVCPSSEDMGVGTHVHDLHTRSKYHHYGRALSASRPDLTEQVHEALEPGFPLHFVATSEGRFGLDTQRFNADVRERLRDLGRWRSEVAVIDEFGHALLAYDPSDRTRTGYQTGDLFDLAVVDECINATRVWNVLCSSDRMPEEQRHRFLAFAEPHLRAHWSEGCSCLRDAVLARAPNVADAERGGRLTKGPVAKLAGQAASLPILPIDDGEQLILGEVQLGNWGLAYRDAGRILAAREKLRDGLPTFFLVVVLDGCLSGLISTGTVNFAGVERVLAGLGRQLTVPTWVIGVDFAHEGTKHPGPRRT